MLSRKKKTQTVIVLGALNIYQFHYKHLSVFIPLFKKIKNKKKGTLWSLFIVKSIYREFVWACRRLGKFSRQVFWCYYLHGKIWALLDHKTYGLCKCRPCIAGLPWDRGRCVGWVGFRLYCMVGLGRFQFAYCTIYISWRGNKCSCFFPLSQLPNHVFQELLCQAITIKIFLLPLNGCRKFSLSAYKSQLLILVKNQLLI